ncbi:MAG: hypothetical protein IJQ65_01035, partial [Kiritimatiellae bacterium]|nr:hypothetical protein [Kiritimatiellia bacterium]
MMKPVIGSAVVVASLAACAFDAADAVRLPGEDDARAAISCSPFPDALSAFVWRNWGLVDTSLLAETVGATADDLRDVAQEMGLPRDPVVLPEWKTKGYITVIRRNWHLLPYDQLLK